MATVALARVSARATDPPIPVQVRLAAVSVTRTGTGASARVVLSRIQVRGAANAKVTISRVQVVSHSAVQGAANQYTYDGATRTLIPTTTLVWDSSTHQWV